MSITAFLIGYALYLRQFGKDLRQVVGRDVKRHCYLRLQLPGAAETDARKADALKDVGQQFVRSSSAGRRMLRRAFDAFPSSFCAVFVERLPLP